MSAANKSGKHSLATRMSSTYLRSLQGTMGRHAILAAAALVVLGCGAGHEPAEVAVEGTLPATAAEGAAPDGDPAPERAAEADPPGTDPPGTQAPAGVQHCSDVPKLESLLVGSMSPYQNPDPIVQDVMFTYGMEHPDTFGGLWIDRDNGGVLVAGFTDDPGPHLEALLARAPSPDDIAGLDPRPPITDDRPLGERDDVVIDVIRVRFSDADIGAVMDEVGAAMRGEDYGLDGMGFDRHRQRVNLYLVTPPDGALDRLAGRLPDPSEVCVYVEIVGEAPDGPLVALPGTGLDDPVVACPDYEAIPSSQLAHLRSIDEIDHPAVDALRAELEAPSGEPLPPGRWVVVDVGYHEAEFAVLSPAGSSAASFERPYGKDDGQWRLAGTGWAAPCAPRVPLPPGLAHVEVGLDPEQPPDPQATSIGLLVTREACASGQAMGDALRGPQVSETDDAVLVAFAYVITGGSATCPGNPHEPVTVELAEPLGERAVFDGLHYPPRRLTPLVE